MNWLLSPSPDGQGEQQWAYWDDAFSNDELQQIIDLGDSCEKQQALVGSDGEGIYNEEVRDSLVYFMGHSLLLAKMPFLLHRIHDICRKLNGMYFNFELTGFHEPFQYTTYDPTVTKSQKDMLIRKTLYHYSWHQDKGPGGNRPPRKLSMILNLMGLKY